MKQRRIWTSLGIAGVCAALTYGQAFAQVLLSSGSYTQNFDTLGTNFANPWLNNSTLNGWYAEAASTYAVTNYRGDAGSANTGVLYSYGSTDSIERAFGSLGSGTPKNWAYGVRFSNDTGYALTNFLVSFTGEQWRNGGNTNSQSLSFFYRIDSSPIVSSDAPNPDPASTWIPVTDLNFISPTVGSTASALDGNASENRTEFSNIALTGFSVLPGQEIFFRWVDLNDSGNDHGLAIDDLTLSFETNFTAVATAPTINADPTNKTIGSGESASFTISAGGTEPIYYQWYSTNSGTISELYGATTPTFTTNYVPQSADGLGFFAVVWNDQGSVTSKLATLSVTNILPVVTNIQYLRTRLDANYLTSDTSTLFKVEGVVTTPVNLVSGSTPVYSFHIQDGIYGIDVFHRGGFAIDLPSQGDTVQVTASLLSYNGLLELAPVSANPNHRIEWVSSGNPIPTPKPFDFSAIDPATMESTIEGSLVVISNVFIGVTNADGHILAGGTLFLTNLSGQVFKMVNPTPAIDPQGYIPPPFASSITGVISQYTTSTPATNGYSILLTMFSDIVAGTPPDAPTPIALTANTSGSNLILNWADTTGLFSLASGSEITGVTNKIVGATSPYTNTMSGSQKFFRLVFP